MTQIDFYFNADEKLQVACRLAGKALGSRKRMLIYAPAAELAQRIDHLLWSWPATGFAPHCAAHDAMAAQTPIVIAATGEVPPGIDLLLNLSSDCPPHFEQFGRLLEIVARDEVERKHGRARYRYYRDRGYQVADHDLAREARHE